MASSPSRRRRDCQRRRQRDVNSRLRSPCPAGLAPKPSCSPPRRDTVLIPFARFLLFVFLGRFSRISQRGSLLLLYFFTCLFSLSTCVRTEAFWVLLQCHAGPSVVFFPTNCLSLCPSLSVPLSLSLSLSFSPPPSLSLPPCFPPCLSDFRFSLFSFSPSLPAVFVDPGNGLLSLSSLPRPRYASRTHPQAGAARRCAGPQGSPGERENNAKNSRAGFVFFFFRTETYSAASLPPPLLLSPLCMPVQHESLSVRRARRRKFIHSPVQHEILSVRLYNTKVYPSACTTRKFIRPPSKNTSDLVARACSTAIDSSGPRGPPDERDGVSKAAPQR